MMSNWMSNRWLTWTTLTTQNKDRGRETSIRRREERVKTSAHTPGPSSQAAKQNIKSNYNHQIQVGKIWFTSLVVRKLYSYQRKIELKHLFSTKVFINSMTHIIWQKTGVGIVECQSRQPSSIIQLWKLCYPCKYWRSNLSKQIKAVSYLLLPSCLRRPCSAFHLHRLELGESRNPSTRSSFPL